MDKYKVKALKDYEDPYKADMEQQEQQKSTSVIQGCTGRQRYYNDTHNVGDNPYLDYLNKACAYYKNTKGNFV